jgi:hypothetical protein
MLMTAEPGGNENAHLGNPSLLYVGNEPEVRVL